MAGLKQKCIFSCYQVIFLNFDNKGGACPLSDLKDKKIKVLLDCVRVLCPCCVPPCKINHYGPEVKWIILS